MRTHVFNNIMHMRVRIYIIHTIGHHHHGLHGHHGLHHHHHHIGPRRPLFGFGWQRRQRVAGFATGAVVGAAVATSGIIIGLFLSTN